MKNYLGYMKKVENIYLFLFISLCCVAIYFPLSLQNKDFFSSPDENSIYYFAKLFSSNSTQSYTYKYNQQLSYDAIKPRLTIVSSGRVVPILSDGMIIVAGIFSIIFSSNFILLLTPIIFTISIFFYHKLMSKLFSSKIGLLSAIEYATLAPFLYLVTKPMVLDIATLSFFIIGIYYFIFSDNKPSRLFLTGFFWGYSLFFNHKFIFVIFVAGISYCLNLMIDIFHKRIFSRVLRNFLKTIFYLFIGFLPPFGIILYTNKMLYGSLLKDGYIASSQMNQAVGATKSPIFYIAFDKIYLNSSTYFFNIFSPLFLVLIILGLLSYFFCDKEFISENKQRFFIFFLFLCSFLTFSYFASIASWGYNINTISASFVRYLILIYSLFIPFIFVFTFKFKKPFLTTIVIVLINIFSFIYYLDSGYLSTYGYVKGVETIRKEVLHNTKASDIIVTDYYDKVIFPYRETADLSSLPVNYVGTTPKIRSDLVIKLILYLTSLKKTVLVMNDIDPNLFMQINQQFLKKGYTVTNINLDPNTQMLKIAKIY